MDTIRVIVGEDGELVPRYAGARNMAIDEALLRTASADGATVLRFYGWANPTLSLGYFQRLADRDTHTASLGCDLVRRASGGGAILHHHELTYSLVTPVKSRFQQTEQLYWTFHETLVESLAEFGVVCELHNAADGLRDDSFLCFQRRASGDVTLGGNKIAGSAQRRWKNAVLQHGSVLFTQSSNAPELPGLGDLSSFHESTDAFALFWQRKLAHRLKVAGTESHLSDTEDEESNRLIESKFADSGWTARR